MNTAAQLHTLHPGGVVCAQRGDRLETLLGSCVAIVLADRARTTGAMCHIVHPSPAPSAAPDDTVYADAALKQMYRLLQAQGLNPRLCEAYVYGGGNMFPQLVSTRHVGDANAAWALEALAHDGVHVLFHDLGGRTYRRLVWTVGAEAPTVHAVAV